jgi:hypothetical protein
MMRVLQLVPDMSRAAIILAGQTRRQYWETFSKHCTILLH